MYLYDKVNGDYLVYSLKEKDGAVFSYKQAEMKKNASSLQILCAFNQTLAHGDTPLFEYYANQFDTHIIPYEEVYMNNGFTNRNLSVDNIKEEEKKTLFNNYFQGMYNLSNIARIQDKECLRYLLLTKEKYYRQIDDNRYMKLSGIIEIPKSLFLLQMFQQEKFDFLDESNLSELLALFELSKVQIIRVDELMRFDSCGITNNSCEQVDKKSQNDAKVLELIRKR